MQDPPSRVTKAVTEDSAQAEESAGPVKHWQCVFPSGVRYRSAAVLSSTLDIPGPKFGEIVQGQLVEGIADKRKLQFIKVSSSRYLPFASPSSTHKAALFQEVDLSPGGDSWTCKRCTFDENPSEKPECTLCQSWRPVLVHQTLQTGDINNPLLPGTTYSQRNRREILRDELVILAPTIRLIFQEVLPDTSCSYLPVRSDDIDQAAYEYLADAIFQYAEAQNVCVFPLNTTGDGSCLLHAVSRGIWGVELFSDVLRQAVCNELETHGEWYREYVGQEDWKQALRQAKTPGAYLSNVHAVACAHVLQRPLLIHASNKDIEMFGKGYWGVAGLHLPIRLAPELVYGRPVVVGWQSSKHDHYVPLVWSRHHKSPDWSLDQWFVGEQDTGGMMDPFEAEARVMAKQINEAVEIVHPTFIENLVNRIVEVHTQTEELHKKSPMSKEQKSKKMQELLLSRDHDLRELLGEQAPNTLSPRRKAVHTQRWKAAATRISRHLSGVEEDQDVAKLVPSKSALSLLRLATDLQMLKAVPIERTQVTAMKVDVVSKASARLRVEAADGSQRAWTVDVSFPGQYPHQPPEFKHEDISIVSLELLDSWSPLLGLPRAVAMIVQVLDRRQAQYPYDEAAPAKEAWIQTDIKRVARETQARRLSAGQGNSQRKTMFGDSSDSDEGGSPFQSSREAQAALDQVLAKPKPGSKPTFRPSNSNAPTPEAEGSTLHSEAKLRALGYMKLKKLLLSQGLSKSDVDAQFGVDFLVLLAKKKGLCTN